MSASCQACTRPVTDSAALCSLCSDGLRRTLASAPSWAQRLEITRTRQSKTGGRGIGVISRTEDRPVPWDERASRACDHLRAELVGVIRILIDDHPGPMCDDTLPDMARWLLGRVDQWRRHDAAAEMWDSVNTALKMAEEVVDRAPDKQFLGICSSHIEDPRGGYVECTNDVYALMDAHETTCEVCGTVHVVAERRRALLDALEEQLLTGREIVEMSKLDQRVNQNQLDRWVKRGKLTEHFTHHIDAAGEVISTSTYRMGDVRDILAEEMHSKDKPRRCACGCGQTLPPGSRKYADDACRRRINAKRMSDVRMSA